MNKPSERIVVFVTPAQKRAIAATADGLGISVSELMRRAVIAFSATSDQVKAASIVDRLNAPREPDALAQVLRKAARPLRHGRGSALRGTLGTREPQADESRQPHGEVAEAGPLEQAAAEPTGTPSTAEPADPAQTALPSPASTPAFESAVGRAAREIAQAVARLTAEADAANTADTADTGLSEADSIARANPLPAALPGFPAAMHAPVPRDEVDAPRAGPTPGDGHFA